MFQFMLALAFHTSSVLAPLRPHRPIVWRKKKINEAVGLLDLELKIKKGWVTPALHISPKRLI
jgi:hypothetical protein